MTDEQAEVVRVTATSGHGVQVVEALAGTGKTYTAGVLRSLYEGCEVRASCPLKVMSMMSVDRGVGSGSWSDVRAPR